MNYGMIGFVIPLSIYPDGYLGKKDQPLPFMSIASQKNNIAVYNLGMYADSKLSNWFKSEYEKTYPSKLDIGKSCLRFKKMEHIPFSLIGELSKKVTAEQWIKMYEIGQKKKNYRK